MNEKVSYTIGRCLKRHTHPADELILKKLINTSLLKEKTVINNILIMLTKQQHIISLKTSRKILCQLK